MGDSLRLGLVGAGQISGAYLKTLPRLTNVTLTTVADLDGNRAAAVAAQMPDVRAVTPEELYAADDVDLVLNLTIPRAHAEVAHAAIAAGKHVYGEKPLAATTEEARAILTAAAEAGVAVGCAPDTVLGTGVQTARASLDAGDIGSAVAATAFMVTPGHERWHPAPEFYYQPGGGPLLDMGPYYLTALVTLLGPVRRVVGMSATPRATRVIGSGPRAGTRFPVQVATHVTGVLEHAGGALSTLMMSFDVWDAQLPRIEVYGTGGSLSVPDPNGFDGTVRIFEAGRSEWADVPENGGYRGAARGYGLADMARAIAEGTPHRADGELAYHVLDVIESLLASADAGAAVEVGSTCARPAPVASGARPEQA
ncbi:Gfo/Idh/MocA family oxidoreductase [Actinoallomurus liliacearum]|uniref:Gfo/Idh/MocA family oxidoreductase n=1 Tax=Actinoallomurus liliacearum TaxID=1080073 RepID=A0ABP8TGM3_9ACTN